MTDAPIKPQSGVGDIDRGVLPSSDLKLQELDAEHQENAVGYREYLEAIDLEVSDKEFMDKTSLNYANVFGYQAALSLKGQQFNYLSAMVYAGYFFGQYPCGWLIGRYPAQRVMAISIFFWGLMVILMTQTRTYSSALGVRFIMGIFEAAVTPSSLGWGGIIGSYISMGVSKLPADLKPERWELIFFMLGGVTCVWSLVIWFLLPDSPSNAFFLNHRERLVAVKRVSENETGIKNKAFDKKQALLGSFDPKTLLLFTAIPNGVVNSFSTVIIRDMGFSITQTTQLKSVGDAVQIVALLIGGTVILNVKDLKQSEAPHFRGATIGLLVGYAIKLICHLTLLVYMYLVNRHRDKKYGEPNRESSKEAGMRDQTEFENKDFRYVL
ncbi:hypothetical protein COL26b_004449 [Colletotrichum chrysophilum]|uniref:uncharacterized protein n=1 Tax=Colletotrichum chrysophilum TaxID=1836956 RepID=UPI00230083DC|nr:uncharacterized protein COL26b_004449 [Colletotrichum chrysophilum]KAJ0377260.1 hypothetical protein COL26b_004449 [Colletotrichum chrysophilum]